MFSLLLNIYAKWHPEMFNPYLQRIPRDWGEWRGGQGLRWESAIAAVLPVPPWWFVVKHQCWPLASGPGRETWLYCCLKKCAPSQAYIYVLSGTKGIRRTGWKSRKVLWGVGFSWEQQDKKQKWGGRQGNTQKEEVNITYCTSCWQRGIMRDRLKEKKRGDWE